MQANGNDEKKIFRSYSDVGEEKDSWKLSWRKTDELTTGEGDEEDEVYGTNLE